MKRPSSPLEDLEAHYDVIVVGSGYGGGVAASSLARADGTSLIDASVALPPDPWVLDDRRWPAALRSGRDCSLADCFIRRQAASDISPAILEQFERFN